jgi:hypothetical protein
LIKQSKNYDENSEVNQINLFDSQTNQEFLINFEDYPAWNEQEKLKESLSQLVFSLVIIH